MLRKVVLNEIDAENSYCFQNFSQRKEKSMEIPCCGEKSMKKTLKISLLLS